ncbi:MAG: beta-ketoacyl-ACP synthase II [Chloroflexi bacterium]|nr:beta-ketoacyl-ACP synthase II [Chloroflexota bacterium]
MSASSGFGRQRSDSERVVISGMGMLTPLGLSVAETWEGLRAGCSGIGPITLFDSKGYPTQIAGEIKGFDPKNYMDAKEARRMARFSQIALAAAMEAIHDARLDFDTEDRSQAGVLLGTCVGGIAEIEESVRTMVAKGGSRVSPHFVTMMMHNAPAGNIARTYSLRGYNSTATTACAAGTQAIGEATAAIRRGVAQVMISGGTEAPLCEVGLAGFGAMRAFTTRNDVPAKASRPFDGLRDGIVGAEAVGVIILESLPHARARDAHIYAEVLGFGVSSDAYHMAAPDPQGAGAALAMRFALEDAGIGIKEVDYINAHATSTVIGDMVEVAAIKQLFGEQAYHIPISATKSMLGHSIGATGGVETIVSVLSIRDNILHPTVNQEQPDPACDLDFVPNAARHTEVNIVLSNSFGMGGQNACLVLGRF